jgi:hypothetical protein
MKKQNKKATVKKKVTTVAPKNNVKRTFFVNPDGTLTASYKDAITWDKH